MTLLLSVLLLTACATLTPEERAARVAELKTAVGDRHYRINITSMTPMRGVSHTVFNHWLKVDGDKVTCDLPYLGRNDIPHPKTPAELHMDSRLDFEALITDYALRLDPANKRAVITFNTASGIDKYKFKIVMESSGLARVHVDPDERDFIDYEGSLHKL